MNYDDDDVVAVVVGDDDDVVDVVVAAVVVAVDVAVGVTDVAVADVVFVLSGGGRACIVSCRVWVYNCWNALRSLRWQRVATAATRVATAAPPAKLLDLGPMCHPYCRGQGHKKVSVAKPNTTHYT